MSGMVELRPRLFANIALACILDDAHHVAAFGRSGGEALPKRALARPVKSREGLVDHRILAARAIVARLKPAASKETKPDRLSVATARNASRTLEVEGAAGSLPGTVIGLTEMFWKGIEVATPVALIPGHGPELLPRGAILVFDRRSV
jgi:hypothetical protein